jgi:hypothetical protein
VAQATKFGSPFEKSREEGEYSTTSAYEQRSRRLGLVRHTTWNGYRDRLEATSHPRHGQQKELVMLPMLTIAQGAPSMVSTQV